jgi:lipopolysaccharide/colanic/teichoic acid biosynthesis glycosyltransferase
MPYLKKKRFFDICFALFLFITFLPIFIFISIIIKVSSKGPVLFIQTRLGFNQNEFRMIKFRTMKVNSEFLGSGQYSFSNDPRVTPIGRFLRKTSLDELPQILNILFGEMSFIGPRPTLPYHPYPLSEYPLTLLKRFKVRPGITGLAQINGRKEISWSERFKYDLNYVENLSFSLDVKIFLLTIKKVISMEDNVNINKTIDR